MKLQSIEVVRLLLLELKAYFVVLFANKPLNQSSRGKYKICFDVFFVHTILYQLKFEEMSLEAGRKQLSSGKLLLKMVVPYRLRTQSDRDKSKSTVP